MFEMQRVQQSIVCWQLCCSRGFIVFVLKKSIELSVDKSCSQRQGVYFCKPHFKQLFALKGNYSEGFGKNKLIVFVLN
jgi:hypothetical protein